MMTEIPEMSRAALNNNTLVIAQQYPNIHTFPGPLCHLNQLPQVGAIAEASKLLCMGSAMKSKRLSIGPF